MSKQPINRKTADHLKEGVKNIKTSYEAMYTKTAGMGGPAANLKTIVTGKTGKGMEKKPAAMRAKAAAAGVLSVTPLGPVASFASGVAKSVQAKADAKVAKAAAAAAKNAPPGAPKTFLKIKPQSAPTAAPARPTKPAPGGTKVAVKPTTTPAAGPKIAGARGAAKEP
jgi:hypothetical protein